MLERPSGTEEDRMPIDDKSCTTSNAIETVRVSEFWWHSIGALKTAEAAAASSISPREISLN